MIVQRRVEFNGDYGIRGIYWQDIDLPEGDIGQMLINLDDPIWTEYRIIREKFTRATIVPPPLPNKEIKFSDNSA